MEFQNLVPEIKFSTLVGALKPFYDLRENKKKHSTMEDKYVTQMYGNCLGISQDEVAQMEANVQKKKAFTMSLGNLHQVVLGSFAGWCDLKTGHESGCDVASEDGTQIAEIKNAKNTMNSSSQKAVLDKLRSQVALGKKAYIVIIYGDIRKKEEEGITWISGRDFYTMLSGRETFFDDLHKMINDILEKVSSYEQLSDFQETP